MRYFLIPFLVSFLIPNVLKAQYYKPDSTKTQGNVTTLYYGDTNCGDYRAISTIKYLDLHFEEGFDDSLLISYKDSEIAGFFKTNPYTGVVSGFPISIPREKDIILYINPVNSEIPKLLSFSVNPSYNCIYISKNNGNWIIKYSLCPFHFN